MILTCVQCAPDSPWVKEARKVNVSTKTANYFAPSKDAESYEMDSTLYTKMLEQGNSDFCARAAAFAMSDLELERKLPNRCHSQYYNFGHCTAQITEDTVVLVFKTHNFRRSIASNKLIKVSIVGTNHKVDIVHWGEEYRETEQLDGRITSVKSPTSKIVNSKLKLNQRYYELGDTIIGEVKIVSEQVKGKRKMRIREESKGKFRAIVGGFDLDCTPRKSLATSWLK